MIKLKGKTEFERGYLDFLDYCTIMSKFKLEDVILNRVGIVEQVLAENWIL